MNSDQAQETVTSNTMVSQHPHNFSETEKQQLSGWNPLLWLDYLNADGAGAYNILKAERSQIDEYERNESGEEQPENQNSQAEDPTSHHRLLQEEKNRMGGWAQFLWLDYMNADAAAAQRVLKAKREEREEYERKEEEIRPTLRELEDGIRKETSGRTAPVEGSGSEEQKSMDMVEEEWQEASQYPIGPIMGD
ncbi:hypothetical protein P152DRAFT_455000 [Eremomyces bilateralis CBS 781.70]|uniref:Uncharacterized protein n=1 Tax=Eremomyces bilateralis CBS 781.70 TaxID=1392243 RepID=A0A6G1GFW2_9PEZI|nr:uncharacterized protein P152DRAFT_455000 [Eremomyces bilateralis CBS 781.70]KAF1816759.1 hypothetical protein P152DRAFT_455000 [Eremomyces bilateralis CBS 781.70]